MTEEKKPGIQLIADNTGRTPEEERLALAKAGSRRARAAAKDVMTAVARLAANLMRITADAKGGDGMAIIDQVAEMLEAYERLRADNLHWGHAVSDAIVAGLVGMHLNEETGRLERDDIPHYMRFDPDGIGLAALEVVAQKLSPRRNRENDYKDSIPKALQCRDDRLENEARLARGEFNEWDFACGWVPPDRIEEAVLCIIRSDRGKLRKAAKACGVEPSELRRWRTIPDEHVTTIAGLTRVKAQVLRPNGCYQPEKPTAKPRPRKAS
jgi:hypothetical protein